jgi:hypothetical protein
MPASAAVREPLAYAAASLLSPVGFGSRWGAIGIGAYYADQHDDVGNVALSLGLGNPDSLAGAEISIVSSAVRQNEGSDNGLGDLGLFNLKLHRNLGDYTAVAIGATATGKWGDEDHKFNNPAGYYAAATRAIFIGQNVLMISGGLGENVSNKEQASGLEAFASASYYLAPWLSLIVENNGRFTDAAISIAPLPRYVPMTITTGVVNVLERFNQGRRTVITVGMGFHF